LRRIWCAVARSGMEPAVAAVSARFTRTVLMVRESARLSRCVLSCMSMDSDAVTVTVLPRLGGDFSGDEKMPEMGSRPCSSYTPRSVSVMPVFLAV
jgi:hypothetical protein